MTWANQQDENTAFKTQTSQLCSRCGQYGRASIPVFFETANGPKFLCHSVICIYCNDKRGQWETMYTGTPDYPDYQCRATRLPPGLTWNIVQRALMAKPTRRFFKMEDFEKARDGRLF